MPQTAIELLKEDHRRVTELLEQLVRTSDYAQKKREKLVKDIERELMVHTRIPQEISYPAFKDADGKEHLKPYHQAPEEHRAVEELVLPDLVKTNPTAPEFAGRAKVLQTLVHHHIEEDGNEMLPQAGHSIDSQQAEALGYQLAERKKRFHKNR